MGLFRKIGELLSGESSSISEQGNSVGSKSDKKSENKSNAVEVRDMLKKSLLEIADSVYLVNPEASKGKNIRIWVSDGFTYEIINGSNTDLLTYLSVERGYGFASIDICEGTPVDESNCRIVNLGNVYAFVELKKNGVNNKVSLARIKVFEGHGKLAKDFYELSREAITNGDIPLYNIGRGASPRIESGEIRQNHIVIDDNECLDYNKYVSRAHAHIGYSETIGFYLQVEYGGSRISGSRTRILRGNEKIEMENLLSKEPLQDGDLIELGKSVILVYNEEKTY